MDGFIGHWHTHYQVVSATPAGRGSAARLDQLARTELAPALNQALTPSLGEDKTVYVIRHFQTRLALRLDNDTPTPRVVQHWAQRISAALVRYLANAPDDANLIRFADQADYIAHFIGDLLQGQAAHCWYYGALRRYQTADVAEGLRALLLDGDPAQRTAILGYLQRYGTLEKVLPMLNHTTLQQLWTGRTMPQTDKDAEALRPLFTHALHLITQLDLWVNTPPSAESLFQGYLATAPAPVDWRDRQGLALGVLQAIHYLADQGLLRGLEVSDGHSFAQRLDQALAALDWLDSDWLRTALLTMLGETASPVAPSQRPTYQPTPRQQMLLHDLAAILAQARPLLDPSQPDSPANALQLYTLLVAHNPAWADDELVSTLLARLGAAWAALIQSRSPAQTLRALQQADLARALTNFPTHLRDNAARALEPLVDLGEPALTVLQELLDPADAAPGEFAFLAELDPARLLLLKVLVQVQPYVQPQPESLPAPSFAHLEPALAAALTAFTQLDATAFALVAHMIFGAALPPGVALNLPALPPAVREQIAATLRLLAALDATMLTTVQHLVRELPAQERSIARELHPQVTALRPVLNDLDQLGLALVKALTLSPLFGEDEYRLALDLLPSSVQIPVTHLLDTLTRIEDELRAQVAQELLGALYQPEIDHLLALLPAHLQSQVVPVLARWAEDGEAVLHWIERARQPAPLATLPAALSERLAQRALIVEPTSKTGVLPDPATQAPTVRPPKRPLLPVMETQYAELFLLLRALQDARFPTVGRSGAAAAPAVDPLSRWLVDLAVHWAGAAASAGGNLDPGVALFAGLPPALTGDDWRSTEPQVANIDHLLTLLPAHLQSQVVSVLARWAEEGEAAFHWIEQAHQPAPLATPPITLTERRPQPEPIVEPTPKAGVPHSSTPQAPTVRPPAAAVTLPAAPRALSPKRPLLPVVETQCAGLFLLLRALQDARFPTVVRSFDAFASAAVAPLAQWLVDLALHWAGAAASAGGNLDPGVAFFAGLPPALTGDSWRSAEPPVTDESLLYVQRTLLRNLAGQRLVQGAVLHLYQLELPDNKLAVVAGDESAMLWPLGQVIAQPGALSATALDFCQHWQAIQGYAPTVVAASRLDQALRHLPDLLLVAEEARMAAGETGSDPASRHRAGQVALQKACTALGYRAGEQPQRALTTTLTAALLLRLWARWLRRFETSSVPYLLENFIRRPGCITVQPDMLLVEMEARPLDVVIEMAGYFADVERVSWLGNRTVKLRVSSV